MTTKGLISVIIPSRNEPYLYATIQDLLKNATGEIEVIAVLDGYWPMTSQIIQDNRVIYLHRSKAQGMRNGINSGVAIAHGEYILKCDAHCLFGKGFDQILKDYDEKELIQVPRRYALDPLNWKVEDNPKYPIDRMYLSADMHGVPWGQSNPDLQIEETPSSQGSCWFMKKDYYHELELLDEENYGTFFNEFQEIGLKCWLSGGRVIVNKNTFYAHWHKPSDYGRGYSLGKDEQKKALSFLENWRIGKGWHKQKLPLSFFKERFPDMPGW